ncbi:hypothetical protein FRC01_001359 [Tulasnella sp. 417]|nr:hypothetical protein FRC01_001359 [Tulasnella sp. 417]
MQYYKHQERYSNWLRIWNVAPSVYNDINSAFIKDAAIESGWILKDLRNAPTVKWLMDACGRERCLLTHTWWSMYKGEITKEVSTLAVVRVRRTEERARVQRQKYLEQLWRSLTQSRPNEGYYSVPPLNIFLSLPFVRNVAKTEVTDLEAEFSEGGAFQALLDTEISAWAHNTQKTLAAALGYKRTGGKSKSASEHYKDLREFLNRATSLFECSNCRRTGPTHEQWTMLTHESVVEHRCPKGTTVTHVDSSTGEERKKENRDWDVNNFVPDKVAIAAVRLAFRVADPPIDESEIVGTVGSDERLGPFHRYVCLTCPSRITMNIWEVPGHAKRHKALFEASSQSGTSDGDVGMASSQSEMSDADVGMRFELGWVAKELCTEDGLPIRSAPYQHLERLMSNTPSGKRKRALREYACRHCEFVLTKTSRTPRLFTVDGLQSHLKLSHGIYPLRNEDFFQVRKLSSDILKRAHQSAGSSNPVKPRSDAAVAGRSRTSSHGSTIWTEDQPVVDESNNVDAIPNSGEH